VVASIACSAFCTRLIKTCRSCSTSIRTGGSPSSRRIDHPRLLTDPGASSCIVRFTVALTSLGSGSPRDGRA
jgi:hypothetical protein